MATHTDSDICPVCNENMETYMDTKPFTRVNGQCIYCGFVFHTKTEQMDLVEINDQREQYSECHEDDDFTPLKPLTQKQLNKFKKKIDSVLS